MGHFGKSLIRAISIHAPREGGDFGNGITSDHLPSISIHAPREGGDQVIEDILAGVKAFQSTPPARGATSRLRGPSLRP